VPPRGSETSRSRKLGLSVNRPMNSPGRVLSLDALLTP
jgi:hypothetical protein